MLQGARGTVGHHRCAAKIAHVVGAAGFIQQQVPVDPAHRPAVEVVDDRPPITLAQGP